MSQTETDLAECVASVEPDAPAAAAADEPAPSIAAALHDWTQSRRQVALLLRAPAPDAAWAEQCRAALQRVRSLARRDGDLALYLMLQAASGESGESDCYSTHHAVLCAVAGEMCATWFGWPSEEVDSLVGAALTMNLSMTAMQDKLANQSVSLSEAQREQIDSHAADSAALLTQAGIDDPLWLDVVRLHHDPTPPPAEPTPAQRLAHLLRRIDVYTAKLSRRATRAPVSPAIAVRDACLEADGRPDPVGTAMLRSLGLYPPGTFVELANGEVGVVVRRGAKAHTPIVMALRRHDGGMFNPPVARNTSHKGNAIVRGVNWNAVKVQVDHVRTLNGA